MFSEPDLGEWSMWYTPDDTVLLVFVELVSFEGELPPQANKEAVANKTAYF